MTVFAQKTHMVQLFFPELQDGMCISTNREATIRQLTGLVPYISIYSARLNGIVSLSALFQTWLNRAV